MALYFHVVELDDGLWACRHGLAVYHEHATSEHARQHVRSLAVAQSPASIFEHRRDGTVTHLEDV